MLVNINTVEKVKEFTAITSKFDNVDLDIVYGRYTIDAKSILGIFSIDISKPLNFRIISDNEKLKKEIVDSLSKFIMEE